MKITIIVEGKTEKAFIPHLRAFLQTKLSGSMPRLDFLPYDGRIPTGIKLKRLVDKLLQGQSSSQHVIALTDVYTGTNDFSDAADAKNKMRQWVGAEPRFHPHAAQHDFEAWLLPYWSEIQVLAGHNRNAPAVAPEAVNHGKPPAYHIKELFRNGSKGIDYVKPRDAGRILRGKDLMVSISKCPELKSFVNTILTICGGSQIP